MNKIFVIGEKIIYIFYLFILAKNHEIIDYIFIIFGLLNFISDKFMKRIILFVGLTPGIWITCTNPNASQNTAANVLFKYNLSDAKGYFIKLGASGKLYYYGFLSGIVNTYYRKVTPIDATIWERIYTFKTSTYGFDLDSAETYKIKFNLKTKVKVCCVLHK